MKSTIFVEETVRGGKMRNLLFTHSLVPCYQLSMGWIFEWFQYVEIHVNAVSMQNPGGDEVAES